MPDEQKQLNFNLGDKPIFAEEVAILTRVKVTKNAKQEIEKEGYVELVFVDMLKQHSVGEFVITKNTAKMLAKLLPDTIERLEKELASKTMPKQPEIKTTGDTSYIR